MKNSKLRFVVESDQDFIKTFYETPSMTAALESYGYTNVGGYARLYKRRCEQLGLDHRSKARSFRSSGKTRRSLTHDEVFCENSQASRSSLKLKLSQEQLLPYFCAICEMLPEWNDKPLVLIIDHINGVGDDNRVENLRWLCPNCNSQTDTFSGRNVARNR